jgi:hypothetical protein
MYSISGFLWILRRAVLEMADVWPVYCIFLVCKLLVIFFKEWAWYIYFLYSGFSLFSLVILQLQGDMNTSDFPTPPPAPSFDKFWNVIQVSNIGILLVLCLTVYATIHCSELLPLV